MQSNTFATSGTKEENPICKQGNGATSCETWKKQLLKLSGNWQRSLAFDFDAEEPPDWTLFTEKDISF